MIPTKIVIYTKEPESEELLIETLYQHYQTVITVNSSLDIAAHLKSKTTQVIMVSTDNFKNSLAIYYHAISQVSDREMAEHAFVPLVTRHDEKQAWQAFNAGFADDYIVSRPLYEPHRPIMVCDHLFKEMGIAKKTTENKTFSVQIAQMPERIRNVIQTGIERKKGLKQDFEHTMVALDKALDNAAERIQLNQDVKLDMAQLKQTLSSIRSDEVRPELLKLQNKTIALLEQLFKDTVDATSKAASDAKSPHFNRLYNSQQGDEAATTPPSIPKVLIVDDDAVSLSVTVKSLQPFLVKIDTTNSGRRAFASLNSQPYDLLLIDINLTDCNGLFVIDQLTHSDNDNTQIPKVILTSNRDKQSIQTASKIGASEYLLKPLQADTFVKLCKKYDIALKRKK